MNRWGVYRRSRQEIAGREHVGGNSWVGRIWRHKFGAKNLEGRIWLDRVSEKATIFITKLSRTTN
jgi:hypothetical protein